MFLAIAASLILRSHVTWRICTNIILLDVSNRVVNFEPPTFYFIVILQKRYKHHLLKVCRIVIPIQNNQFSFFFAVSMGFFYLFLSIQIGRAVF